MTAVTYGMKVFNHLVILNLEPSRHPELEANRHAVLEANRHPELDSGSL